MNLFNLFEGLDPETRREAKLDIFVVTPLALLFYALLSMVILNLGPAIGIPSDVSRVASFIVIAFGGISEVLKPSVWSRGPHSPVGATSKAIHKTLRQAIAPLAGPIHQSVLGER